MEDKNTERVNKEINTQVLIMQRNSLAIQILDANAKIEELSVENQILKSTLGEIKNSQKEAKVVPKPDGAK